MPAPKAEAAVARKVFAPAQMLPGPTHTKTGMNDGYFSKFERLYKDEYPLWRDIRKMKMQFERLQKEKHNVKPPNTLKKMAPDEWYGTFGPQYPYMDPRVNKEKHKPEPANYNMYTSKVVKCLEGYPERMKHPYPNKWFVKPTPDPFGRPPFVTGAKAQPYALFDKNPNKVDPKDRKEWVTYNKYHAPVDGTNMKHGVYNNYATQNKRKSDPKNLFFEFPKHMDEKYKKPPEPADSTNMKYGLFNRYATHTRNKADPKNLFSEFPKHMDEKYVDKQRLNTFRGCSDRPVDSSRTLLAILP